MKKLLLLFTIFFFASINQTTKASHVLGGEITWVCLANGQYVFYAKVYRDCTGIPYPFNNKTLQIVGNPLPRSGSNSTISSIVLKPDSATFVANNYGDISPQPVGATALTPTITCANSDPGAVQEFPFQSDPITLVGTPPANGWKFYLVQPCCRPNITNLATAQTMMLRAIMYPPTTTPTSGQCYDTSPKFLASPQYTFCRGSRSTNQFSAFDANGDSLVFSFERTYDAPPAAPQAVPYVSGYSFDNPTPDSSFDVRNSASIMIPVSGLINFEVFNGSPLTLDYLVVCQVDAYRSGQKISTVYRELPITMFDCPSLPNNAINRKPNLTVANQPQGLEINVIAGQTVSLPVSILDDDTSSVSSGLQNIRLTAKGENFASNLVNSQFCSNPPCATLLNVNAIYDTSWNEYVIDNPGAITTNFDWQTSCSHLGSNGEMRTYRFYFKAEDDHPPIPKVEGGYIVVNVYPEEVNPPAQFCGSLSSNDLALSWDNSGVSSTSFVSWRIYKKIGTGNYQLIDTIANYQTTTYLDQNYSSISSSDYFVRPAHTICGNIREGRKSEVFSNTYLSSPQVSLNRYILSTSSVGDYQWYNCDSSRVIPNETSSSFTATRNGNYALILNRGGCVDTTACVTVYGVGLEENGILDQLSIYPNPSNGKVFIDREGAVSLDYQIFNIQGKLMKRGRLAANQNQLLLPDAEGLYFMTIQDESGNTKTYKLIKR